MLPEVEKRSFLQDGYLVARQVLKGDYLSHIKAAFALAWEIESKPVSQSRLLKHPAFIKLIEHPPILERLRSILGQQIQLLQADISRQDPYQNGQDRGWHRDFVFPGDVPLAI